MESRWQDDRCPHVSRTDAGSVVAKLRHRDPTHITRPPPSAEDLLGLPQSLG